MTVAPSMLRSSYFTKQHRRQTCRGGGAATGTLLWEGELLGMVYEQPAVADTTQTASERASAWLSPLLFLRALLFPCPQPNAVGRPQDQADTAISA